MKAFATVSVTGRVLTLVVGYKDEDGEVIASNQQQFPMTQRFGTVSLEQTIWEVEE